MDLIEKYAVAPAVILLAWLGSFEWRMRNKVGHRTLDATIQPMQKQNERIESHLWDIMQAQKITPSMDIPDKIKKNGVINGKVYP